MNAKRVDSRAASSSDARFRSKILLEQLCTCKTSYSNSCPHSRQRASKSRVLLGPSNHSFSVHLRQNCIPLSPTNSSPFTKSRCFHMVLRRSVLFQEWSVHGSNCPLCSDAEIGAASEHFCCILDFESLRKDYV